MPMADIITEIVERRARRAFDSSPVSDEVLNRIFTAATLAPSCSNKQPWRFIVCTADPALSRAREALLGGNYWAQRAPVLVVVTSQDDLDCQLTDDRNYAQFDTGMAVMNMQLQATKEGLYIHPMAGFEPQTVREAFSLGPEIRVITMIAIGYPGDTSHLNEKHLAGETAAQERKGLDEVVRWNPV